MDVWSTTWYLKQLYVKPSKQRNCRIETLGFCGAMSKKGGGIKPDRLETKDEETQIEDEVDQIEEEEEEEEARGMEWMQMGLEHLKN